MRVEIKDVTECRDGSYGHFIELSRIRSRINISRKMNPLLADYMATALHELLHLWVCLSKHKGFKMNNSEEHKFIYAAEEKICELMVRHGRRKTK